MSCPRSSAARKSDAGRRELARARDSRASGWASRVFMRARRGRVPRGRRRPQLPRLGHVLGPADPGPRRPGDARGRRRGRRSAGTSFGAPPGRGRARRGDLRRRPAHRAGALRLLRHRGRDERHPPRPRLHRPRPHPEVRRLLPRPRRLAAGRRGLRRAPRSGIPSSPGVPTGVRPTRRRCPTTTWRPRPRRSRATARGSPAVIIEPVAGNMGVVPPEPGFLEALRDALRSLRRAADLRRGDHRLPRGAGGARSVRHPPDLTILGKIVGGGLPLAAFGGRAEIMSASRRRRRLPGGHALRQSARDGRGPVSAPAPARRERLRRARAVGERLEDGLKPVRGVQRVGAMLTLFLRDEPVRNYRRGARGRRRALRRALPPPARARDLRGSVSVRSAVPLPRPHGRGRRPHRRGRWRLPRPLTSGTRSAPAPRVRARSGRRRCARPSCRSASRSSRRSLGRSTGWGSRRFTRATCSTTGRSRLFAPEDGDTALLLGDYLYAHGLVRIAEHHVSMRSRISPS